jgi:hypothetical protein
LVQPAGEPQAGLERLDWQDALQTYRPFLSHAELEAFFREPSHVYDLLSSVLGLEPLTAAATFLATARKQRENTSAEVKKAVPALLEQVRAIDDERATTCAQELSAKRPDPERVRLAAAGAVTSARQLLDSRSDATAGLWPRACAFLARQALEAAVDEIWAARPSTSGMTKCKMRSQLICLPTYLDAGLAREIAYVYSALSEACHYHAYELAPTAAEIAHWLATIDRLLTQAAALSNSPAP